MARGWKSKLLVLLLIALPLGAYHWWGLGQYFSLQALKTHHQLAQALYLQHPLWTTSAFALIYLTSTALSLPGATVLTLAAGAIFGLGAGTVVVSLASTVGATLAFLTARFFFRDSIQSRFADKLARINHGIEKDGAFYLFTLRLVPVFPFFLVNLVMGLTPIRTMTYFFVSQIGMLPATIAYVNAGTQIAQIDSLSGILSLDLLLSFSLIGFLPLLSNGFIRVLRARRHLRKFKKPRQFEYNLVVIGAGSAGLVSAYIASAIKAKVALIEKHRMGGDCLNTGCVPSKALIRSAKVQSLIARASDFGLDVSSHQVNFAQVMERVHKVIKTIEPHDSVERYQQLGVECLHGPAFLRSPYEVEVNGRVLTTKSIIIATGASPLVPPLPGLSEVQPLTSDNVWNLRRLPRRLVILGGGPIGCELAQSFARLGAQVTLVEMSSRILNREDVEVSTLIAEKLQGAGLVLLTGHKATRVEPASKILYCEFQGREVRVEFDEILVALGRQANVKGFGLEALNIEISSGGTIVADEFLRTTNYPNIYVCGDVTGPYQFTHTASHQAWYAAVNALLSPFKKFKVDYGVIPWCTFTEPEVARVGLNEHEAQARQIPYEVTRYEMSDLDRAIADGEAQGFVKVLTVPGKDQILGVTIVGDHAGDIIAEYVTAMKYGLGLNKILATIHIYPTLAEANKFAAGVWKKAHAPQSALAWLARFHSWRRT